MSGVKRTVAARHRAGRAALTRHRLAQTVLARHRLAPGAPAYPPHPRQPGWTQPLLTWRCRPPLTAVYRQPGAAQLRCLPWLPPLWCPADCRWAGSAARTPPPLPGVAAAASASTNKHRKQHRPPGTGRSLNRTALLNLRSRVAWPKKPHARRCDRCQARCAPAQRRLPQPHALAVPVVAPVAPAVPDQAQAPTPSVLAAAPDQAWTVQCRMRARWPLWHCAWLAGPDPIPASDYGP